MAVLNDAVSLKEKGYATMAKSTVVPFELPSEFSPDPLTEVIQNGATLHANKRETIEWLKFTLEGAGARTHGYAFTDTAFAR